MNTFLDIPLFIWALICLAIALVYYYVWPKPQKNTLPRPRWARALLRYGHSLVWVLFGGVCLVWPLGATLLAQVLGLLALLLYAAFMAAMVWYSRRVKSG